MKISALKGASVGAAIGLAMGVVGYTFLYAKGGFTRKGQMTLRELKQRSGGADKRANEGANNGQFFPNVVRRQSVRCAILQA